MTAQAQAQAQAQAKEGHPMTALADRPHMLPSEFEEAAHSLARTRVR
jgi:hypothetical protein